MTQLSPGQLAPQFSLPTISGEISLQQLLQESEAGVILYFYPRAATPGCTKQACDFRDSLNMLETYGYKVLGISPDPLVRLEKFIQNRELNFPLASDAEHEVMKQYGVWGEKTNYGKLFVGVIRSTFVINPDGVISHALYRVKATGHVERIIKLINLN